MKCENCEGDHDGSYGSGRFCSCKCSRAFATKDKREEINEKVSIKLKGVAPSNKGKPGHIVKWTEESKQKMSATRRAQRKEKVENGTAGGSMVLRYLLEELGNVCQECGITDWNGKPLPMQIHHIDGNNKNNRLENAKLLCPNCHFQTDNWGYKNRK